MGRSSALVLGGGVSGLAAAHRLQQAGWQVELIEATARLGGRLATHTEAALPWELGAHTVVSSPELLAFAAAADVDDDLVSVSPAARRRYVADGGRLVALPAQPLGWLTSPLLSPFAGLRLIVGRLGRWPPRVGAEERLEPALRRRLGAAGGSLLAASTATGVYAGEARELLATEALGLAAPRQAQKAVVPGRPRSSLGRRGRRRLLRPRYGWQAWIDRAAQAVPTRLETRALSARRVDDAFEVEVETADGRRCLAAARLVSALPAAAAARVLAPLGDAGSFATIPHAPVATVVLVCGTDQAARLPDGFGFLDPFDATGGLLGCIFASDIAPEIAPPGSHVLTALVGGTRHGELVELDDGTLVAHAWRALSSLLGLHGEPQRAVVRRWLPGIPQPTGEVLAARQAAVSLEGRHPGLHILGDWLRGVGVPACVAAGWAL